MIPKEEQAQKRLLRALFNVRPPAPADPEFLRMQDEYLQEETQKKGVTDLADLTPVLPDIYLWQGDITTLCCATPSSMPQTAPCSAVTARTTVVLITRFILLPEYSFVLPARN